MKEYEVFYQYDDRCNPKEGTLIHFDGNLAYVIDKETKLIIVVNTQTNPIKVKF